MNRASSTREERDSTLFDRIAEAYSRKDLMPASRLARRMRQERTLRIVPLRRTDRILDIGCGAGFGAAYLDGRFGSYVGIDHSRELIACARARHATPNVKFAVSGIAEYRPSRRFNVVFAIGVIHHLGDVPGALERVVDLLEPGGWFVANEPQPGNPTIRWARSIRKRVDPSYSPDQSQLSGVLLRRRLEDAGLKDVVTRPQGLWSTPFAEVVMRPQWLITPLAALACALDRLAEPSVARLFPSCTWNVTVAGRKPK